MAIQVSFGYLVLVAAFCSSLRFKAMSVRLPDYSYGIYIYGFPAQQAAIALGLGLTPFTNIGWGIVIMLPLAALSWHLIEKPALGLKRHAAKPA
jgi:peptidoglycan/LPS O-acetylase OafA/YrhL